MKLVARKHIGPYEIAAHLDSGGMADVFLATGDKSDELLVIKVILEKLTGIEEIVTMFRDEGRIMSSLSHENVVAVRKSGVQDKRPWIAMEFLQGDHLGRVARLARRAHQKLSPTMVARLAFEAAKGLDYVHKAKDSEGKPLNLVHRDISPQNIFLCYDGRVCLLDFGVALATNREAVTRTGLLKGKVSYMSPEQVRYGSIDGRSDLFSLGIVLWELLVGRRLYKEKSEFDTLKKICEEEPPWLNSLRSDVPDQLCQIVQTCLQKDPDLRFRDAGELVEKLGVFLATQESDTEELKVFSDEVLADRARQKQEIIDSIKSDGELLMRLFEDLDDGVDGSGSLEIALPEQPLPPPVDNTPAREPEPLPILSDTPSGGTLGWQNAAPQGPKPAGGLSRLMPWIVMAVLILVGAGVLGYFHFYASEAQQGSDDSGSDVMGSPSGVMATQSRARTRGGRGILSIDCDRKVRALIKGRVLGHTPIKGVKKKPGNYLVRLHDTQSGQSRILEVEVSKGIKRHYNVVF